MKSIMVMKYSMMIIAIERISEYRNFILTNISKIALLMNSKVNLFHEHVLVKKKIKRNTLASGSGVLLLMAKIMLVLDTIR